MFNVFGGRVGKTTEHMGVTWKGKRAYDELQLIHEVVKLKDEENSFEDRCFISCSFTPQYSIAILSDFYLPPLNSVAKIMS